MALIGCLIVTHRRKAEDWLGVEAECPSASPGSWSSFCRHAGRVMRGSMLWIFCLSRQHLFLPGLFRATCFTSPRSKIASFTNSTFTQKSGTCRIYLWAVYFNHFLSFPLKQSFWSKIGWVTLERGRTAPAKQMGVYGAQKSVHISLCCLGVWCVIYRLLEVLVTAQGSCHGAHFSPDKWILQSNSEASHLQKYILTNTFSPELWYRSHRAMELLFNL